MRNIPREWWLLLAFVMAPVAANEAPDPALCSLYQQRVTESLYSLAGRWQRVHQPLLSIRFVEDLEASKYHCLNLSPPDENGLLCNEISHLLSDEQRFLRNQWAYRMEEDSWIQISLYDLFLEKQQSHCVISDSVTDLFTLNLSPVISVDAVVTPVYLLTDLPVVRYLSWVPNQQSSLGFFSQSTAGTWRLAFKRPE